MGQAFIVAAVSWTFNFFTTILVSLLTKPKSDDELRGLVYALTPRPPKEKQPWYMRVGPIGLILLIITIILNIIFF